MSAELEAEGGCGGCLTLILAVIVLWAICFGVTYNGRHYGISCSCKKGVEVQR